MDGAPESTLDGVRSACDIERQPPGEFSVSVREAGVMGERSLVQDVQGNVAPGFRKGYQALLLVRFPDRAAPHDWLTELNPRVTSAREVLDFVRERRLARERRPGSELDLRATWVNVGLSASGLARLGADVSAFPDEFREGMFARAGLLGDGNPASWALGGSASTEAHAIVIAAADRAEDLDAELAWQEERVRRHGLDRLGCLRGAALPGNREHFGFRDGVSQPRVEGLSEAGADGEDVVPAGELLLGVPDARGAVVLRGPAWADAGSFLVFRQIAQDVALFRRTVTREAKSADLSPEQLAAKLVGRQANGAKLGAPEAPAPERPDRAHQRITGDDFAADPEGRHIPLFAHVRKVHPHAAGAADPGGRRMLRRGIPYGPPLAEGATEDDGVERGLLFLAYQASIAEQFEHVQQRWINSPDVPVPGAGPDAMVSTGELDRRVSLQRDGGSVPLSLEQFVMVRGGGYFFAPSIPALTYLAESSRRERPRAEWTKVADKTVTYTEGDVEVTVSVRAVSQNGKYEPADAAAPVVDGVQVNGGYRSLVECIESESPYRLTAGALESLQLGRAVAVGPASGHNQADPVTAEHLRAKKHERLYWAANDRLFRITKALLIPYRYVDPIRETEVEGTLLVGFQGGPAD
jgi:Dyp-type peroxidase family